jgi:hypothetical protein
MPRRPISRRLCGYRPSQARDAPGWDNNSHILFDG